MPTKRNKNITNGASDVQKLNKTLRTLHEFALKNNNFSFEEFIDICIYPDMVKEWLDAGFGLRKIKKLVFEYYLLYEEQRKLLSV